MSKLAPTSQCDLDDLQAWLEGLVKVSGFAQLIAGVLALVTRLRDLNAELTIQLVKFRRARPRSERLKCLAGQLELQWAMSAATDEQSPASGDNKGESDGKGSAAEKKPPKSRKGKHPGRQTFPDSIERIALLNRVPLPLRACPKCGMAMKTMGHTHCEYLDIVPAKVIVVQRIDEALKCKLDGTIVAAPPLPRIVERGALGNRLIIEATADKYLEHSPLERQCLKLSRMGVSVAPQTLGRCVSAHLDLLAPLAEAIYEKTRGSGLLATDATGIAVLDPTAPEGIRSGTMWGWTNALWVSFFYSAIENSDSVKRFLGEGNYDRMVQSDGTNLLTFIERAGGSRPGCWSHARRGLAMCARSGDKVAFAGVQLIAPLFKVDKDSKDAGDNAAQRLARRQKHSVAVIASIRKWLDEQRAITMPKTPFGKALGYLHRQWKRLVLFLEDGNIALTNNRRERELRKLALGRKNWLFTWDDIGGHRTATILTIVASSISHGLNPREYLVIVTEALLKGVDDISTLLPDRIAIEHPDLAIPSFEPPALPD